MEFLLTPHTLDQTNISTVHLYIGISSCPEKGEKPDKARNSCDVRDNNN